MTNPVSNLPSAQLPLITEPIVDDNGNPTTLFHRFLAGLFLRTGGGAGANTSDALTLAENALAEALAANAEATLAHTVANTAQTAADTAQTTANTALTTGSSAAAIAQHALATQLTALNNLSDLNNRAIARANLGVAISPITAQYDTCPASLSRYFPITRTTIVPANFSGTKTYAATAPTLDAPFLVSYIRSNVSTIIGTITLIHDGHDWLSLSTQPSVSLISGDTLVITTPSLADATLARVGITVSLTIG